MDAGLFNTGGEAFDAGGDVYIADTFNNRIEEVYEGGQNCGHSMTAGDIYTRQLLTRLDPAS